MKKIYALVLLIFTINLANAQWQHTNGPYGGMINCLAVNGNSTFAGTHYGVYLSLDNGNSWAAANTGMPSNTTVEAIAISGSNIFAGTSGNGIYFSNNNGSSCTAVNTGLTNLTIYSLAIKGDTVFAGAYNGGADNSTSGQNISGFFRYEQKYARGKSVSFLTFITLSNAGEAS